MPKLTPHIAQRRFGQNFLIDTSIAAKIVDAAQIHPQDTVIEIGPGQGAITRLLAAKAKKVIAIELDRDLIHHLETLSGELPNIELVYGDALKLYPDIVKGCTSEFLVVANIPYNITSAIIRTILQTTPRASRAILMIQKEVAIRATARAGEMSLLSLSMQLYARIRKVFEVAPGSFRPRPKVSSAIIEIVPHEKLEGIDPEKILALAQFGFAHKRKLLISNLCDAPSANRESLIEVFKHCDILPNARAQDLSVQQWVCLTTELE